MQIYSLVKIPEKVTEDRYKENGVADKDLFEIKDGVLARCKNVGDSSAIIPPSVKQIGYSAFAKCNNLADTYYEGSESEWKMLGVDTPKSTRIHYDYRI